MGARRGTRFRTRARALFVLLVLGLVAASLAVQPLPAPAVTANSTLNITIASASSIDASGCQSGTSNVTDFGTVYPATSVVTSSDCTIAWGSTNDTAMLRIAQADGNGSAMYSPSVGALDTGFDSDGKVVTNLSNTVSERGQAVAAQPDGMVLVGGVCPSASLDRDLCVLRYTTAGAPDGSFATAGRFQLDFGGGMWTDNGYGIAVQPDGKIVLTGDCVVPGTGRDFCVIRLTSAGVLDATFSGDGKQSVDFGLANGDEAYGVALRPDGRIVLAGLCEMGGATGVDICAAQLTAAGALDITFDSDGRKTVAVAPGTGADQGWAVALQGDGKVVIAADCDMGGAAGWDGCLVRLNADGSLDTSFDGDGKVTTGIGSGSAYDGFFAVGVQPNGRIVAAGGCNMGASGNDICVARYTSAGALDTSFDSDGTTSVAVAAGAGGDTAYGLHLQPDGMVLLAGQCSQAASGPDVCLVRLDPNGALDPTFDSDGMLTTAVGSGTNNDAGLAVAPAADGEVVVAGTCYETGQNNNICALSYATNGTAPNYVGGSTDWDQGAAAFGACLRTVSGGATAQWTAHAACPATDGAYWNAVPATSAKVAYTSAAGNNSAVASLRFGLRTAANQLPGSFIAPVTFEVIAPDA